MREGLYPVRIIRSLTLCIIVFFSLLYFEAILPEVMGCLLNCESGPVLESSCGDWLCGSVGAGPPVSARNSNENLDDVNGESNFGLEGNYNLGNYHLSCTLCNSETQPEPNSNYPLSCTLCNSNSNTQPNLGISGNINYNNHGPGADLSNPISDQDRDNDRRSGLLDSILDYSPRIGGSIDFEEGRPDRELQHRGPLSGGDGTNPFIIRSPPIIFQ